jgi:hypothetical protein
MARLAGRSLGRINFSEMHVRRVPICTAKIRQLWAFNDFWHFQGRFGTPKPSARIPPRSGHPSAARTATDRFQARWRQQDTFVPLEHLFDTSFPFATLTEFDDVADFIGIANVDDGASIVKSAGLAKVIAFAIGPLGGRHH